MSETHKLLEEEQVVHDLTIELNKLKNAVNQIADVKNSAKVILESSERIVTNIASLVNIGNAVLGTLKTIDFISKFDKIDGQYLESINKIGRLLKNFDEVNFNQQFNNVIQTLTESINDNLVVRIDKLEKQYSRLGILSISIFVIQIAILTIFIIKLYF